MLIESIMCYEEVNKATGGDQTLTTSDRNSSSPNRDSRQSIVARKSAQIFEAAAAAVANSARKTRSSIRDPTLTEKKSNIATTRLINSMGNLSMNHHPTATNHHSDDDDDFY